MRSPGTPLSPDLPRRHADLPIGPRRRLTEDDPTGKTAPATPEASQPAPADDSPPPPSNATDTERRLIVGREISLSGEISACDHLIVEGRIEAKLKDCRTIEVSGNGVFKGSAEIEEADIGGRFEGDLSVRGIVRVRSTGVITGSLTYGRIEVESGGQLIGSVQPMDPASGASAPAATSAPPRVEPAPEPSAAPDTAPASGTTG